MLLEIGALSCLCGRKVLPLDSLAAASNLHSANTRACPGSTNTGLCALPEICTLCPSARSKEL